MRGGGKFLNLRFLSAKNFTPGGLDFRSCPHPPLPNFNLHSSSSQVRSLKWTYTILKMCI